MTVTTPLIRTWALFAALAFFCGLAFSQDISLLPKYGNLQKSAQQKAADAEFLVEVDARYPGDRPKAAKEVAERGWQFLRQGNPENAMRRFNQAWMIDPKSVSALWGMAAASASSDQGLLASLGLFAEAEKLAPGDIDLAVDYARTIGIAAGVVGNPTLMAEAVRRYEAIYKKAPNHTLNLQNWAIADYTSGNYPMAWKRLKLAEATPQRADIDPNFVKALEAKMPRPTP